MIHLDKNKFNALLAVCEIRKYKEKKRMKKLLLKTQTLTIICKTDYKLCINSFYMKNFYFLH